MKNFLRPLLKSWRNKAANPLAWGIILLVIFLIVGWHVFVGVSRPAHMMEMAAEVGSLGRFTGSPAASPDGSRVSFFRGTETGGGLFVCNLTNGQQRLLYEDPGNRRHAQFGWSPDGKLLAFPGQRNGKPALIIGNGDSGQIEATVLGTVKEFAWLSPASFVFLKGSALMRVDKYPDSGWGHPFRFSGTVKKTADPNEAPSETAADDPSDQVPDTPAPKPSRNGKTSGKKSQPSRPAGAAAPRPYPPIRDLMATSPDAVAWMGRNAIWEWKFHAAAPEKIWSATTNRLLACDYSRETGAFLLRLRDANGDRLAGFFRAGSRWRTWARSAIPTRRSCIGSTTAKGMPG